MGFEPRTFQLEPTDSGLLESVKMDEYKCTNSEVNKSLVISISYSALPPQRPSRQSCELNDNNYSALPFVVFTTNARSLRTGSTSIVIIQHEWVHLGLRLHSDTSKGRMPSMICIHHERLQLLFVTRPTLSTWGGRTHLIAHMDGYIHPREYPGADIHLATSNARCFDCERPLCRLLLSWWLSWKQLWCRTTV